MNCHYCTKTLTDGEIINGISLHKSCIKGYTQANLGRPHICPQCNTSGKILDTSKKIEKWISVPKGEYAPCAYNDCRGCGHCGLKPIHVHPIINCPTCIGYGYTKYEYENIEEKVITGYRKK